MDHFFENIDGWFDFAEPYAWMVEQAPTDRSSNFLELGAWMGRSTAYMAVEIINSGKPITFIVVDTWMGSEAEDIHKEIISSLEEQDLFLKFTKNMSPVAGKYIPVKMASEQASSMFPDGHFDFIWIDAGHTYEDVTSDLKCWFPKVKVGGWIGGHDYTPGWDGVIDAVNTYFGVDYWVRQSAPNSWLVNKNK